MNTPTTAPQRREPQNGLGWLNLSIAFALLGVVLMIVITSVLDNRAQKEANAPLTSPTWVLQPGPLWLNAETAGNHTYLRLNDADHERREYTQQDIELLILRFEQERNVRVAQGWNDGGTVDIGGQSAIRGIILEHEPVK